jgi:hypothetical protein
MTKSTSGSDNAIEQLLQERAQYVGWLTRLNASGETASSIPEAVRGRVRADYERRLQTVVEQLRTHTSALEGQVQTNSTKAAGLATAEAELKEQYAESEIRHLVGEYDDLKWEGIRTELLKNMGLTKDQLEQTEKEIARLNDVLATIRAPARPETAPTPPPAPPIVAPAPPAPEPAASATPAASAAPAPPQPAAEDAESAARSAARKPVPKKEEQGRTLWFPSGKGPEAPAEGGEKVDELAFLKSVTDAGGLSSSGRVRPSGPVVRPAGAESLAPPSEPKAATPAAPGEPPKDRASGSASAPKTLKCGECGTLNRPTEWYCERCGAELATL